MTDKRKDTKGRILRTGESQDKNGRYCYKYPDSEGVRRAVYSWRLVKTDIVPSGKRDCQPLREMEKEIKADIESGIRHTDMTLNQAFEISMTLKKLALSTKENYNYFWNRFVKDSLGRKKITDIKKTDIASLYRQCSERGLADGSIQILQKMIFPALQLAVDDDYIRKNPAYGCCKDYTGIKYVKDALTTEQQNQFVEALPSLGCSRKYVLLLRVLFGTGCRIGEIMGLSWDTDIDMQNRTINIDHEILYRRINGEMRFYAERRTKTQSGARVIPMTRDVYDCFVELYEHRAEHVSIEVDGYKNFVFTCKKGTPLYPANVNTVLRRLEGKYNQKYPDKKIPHVSNHICRHTACTRMAEAEVDMGSLMYLMGHNDMEMIRKVYDHINMDRLKKQMRKVEMMAAE